jgi:hypothetical protein
VYVSILVRRLRPGRTVEDFVAAWYPDRGFGLPAQVTLARNVGDASEVMTVGVHEVDLPLDRLREELARVAAQDAVRHDRIAEVVASTVVAGVYEVVGRYDFSSDASVERARPGRTAEEPPRR